MPDDVRRHFGSVRWLSLTGGSGLHSAHAQRGSTGFVQEGLQDFKTTREDILRGSQSQADRLLPGDVLVRLDLRINAQYRTSSKRPNLHSISERAF